MGFPVVTGDIGGIYTFPSVPPQFASFPMVLGSVVTLFEGKSVMLVGNALTAGGPIATSTLFTTTTFVENLLVHLGGSVTNLATGWLTGVLAVGGAPTVQTT